MRRLAIALVAGMLATSGCATVLSGPSRLEVDVEAPEGPVLTTVRAVEDGARDTRDQRRFVVDVVPTSHYVVVSSGDGMGHTIKVVRPQMSPLVWGNAGFALLGMLVSAASPTRTIDGATGVVLSSVPNQSYMAMGLLAMALGIGLDVYTKHAWQLDQRQVDMVLERREPATEPTP